MDGMNGHMDDDMEHMDYGDESGQMVSQSYQLHSQFQILKALSRSD